MTEAIKTALIFGISGQDGSYLAQLLLDKHYEVHGTSRDIETRQFRGLDLLGIKEKVVLHSVSVLEFRNILDVVELVEPDEIYYLSGQSSVGLSFTQPFETFESISVGVLQVLEVIRHLQAPIRFYHASSGECYGEMAFDTACAEDSPFHPQSPYAVAKATAHWLTANYRKAYGLFACSGILFNHESILRPERFVTRKIIATALKIANGENIKLELGNINIWRDWGYAPEYVDAMWKILQTDSPDDYLIATGESHSLKEFVAVVFEKMGLNWKDHVIINNTLLRPSDLMYSRGNPQKAFDVLGWRAKTRFYTLIELLIEAEQGK